MSPTDAVNSFELSLGFRIELVASEPLISEPTGVCWDEKGRLYVSELHGYNLEGQLEIEAMNEAGVIDTVVQRVEAAEKYKRAAEPGVFGQIKRLSDTNRDGMMDTAKLFAGNLPPAYGCTAARNGLIVAGQTEIIYIADKNGDGKAEVKDTLFSGWQDSKLERGISSPQWEEDGWIYFSSAGSGGSVSGPNLEKPVQMPRTDFRIRSDGSAIEPVVGGGTIGSTFNDEGYRFFTRASYHAYYAIPIQWKYLERNPYVSISTLTVNAADYSNVFPIAPTHPWRLTRSHDPEWREFYLDLAGEGEVIASGNMTSACCPLIYRKDDLFPTEFIGNLFVSEPAQSLIHRSIVVQNGTGLKVRRADNEQDREFLSSTDSWFSPTGLAQAPDGSLYISDFYREIIEDYSAVPRPMQQKYGLMNGSDMGRIWRVSPVSAKALNSVGQVDMTNADLEKELDSPHYWRRKTANRLLHEQQGDEDPALMKQRLKLTELTSNTPANDFISTLRRQDNALKSDVSTARKLAKMSQTISDEHILLQLTLSLGYSRDTNVFESLINLAREHANIRWMPDAIMTGTYKREEIMLKAILNNSGATGQLLLNPLAASISARGNEEDLLEVLSAIVKSDSPVLQIESLEGLNSNMKAIRLKEKELASLSILLKSDDLGVREQGLALALNLNIDDFDALDDIRQQAMNDVVNQQLTTEKRLEAVSLLSSFSDELAGSSLIDAWKTAPPPIKTAILESLISRENQFSTLIDAISSEVIPLNYLTSFQRIQLINRANIDQRSRLEDLFAKDVDPDKTIIFERYVKTLEEGKANAGKGQELFQKMCASCHQAKNIGIEMGPNLDAALSSSKEALIRDILWPNERISSGYELYVITTNEGEKHSGVLVSESPSSIVLGQIGGNEQTFLRNDIKNMTSSQSTLMPSFLGVLTPKEVADIIEWLHK